LAGVFPGGDAFSAARGFALPTFRIHLLATRVPADDQLWPGAAQFVTTDIICKAFAAGTACAPTQVLAFVARLGRRAARGYSQESRPKQRPPGGTPGSRRREEVSQAIKSLVIHWRRSSVAKTPGSLDSSSRRSMPLPARWVWIRCGERHRRRWDLNWKWAPWRRV
jgi:hypothetical protein